MPIADERPVAGAHSRRSDAYRRKRDSVPHRREGYNFLVVSEWLEPADNARNIAWARESYDPMRPCFTPGRYVNYLGDDDGEDAVAAAYGPNYQRLRALKAKYDPTNLFHLNQNIRPG